MISISDIIGSLVMSIANIYVWKKQLNRKINFCSFKFYFLWIILIMFPILNSLIFTSYIKIVPLTLVYMLIIKFLFKAKNQYSIITPIFSQILIMISEGLCLLLLVLILNLNLEQLKDRFLETVIINILISIIYIIISKIPFVKKIYNNIIVSIDKLNNIFLIFFSMIIITIANVLAAITYFQIDIKSLIFINILFTLIYFIIIIYLLKVRNNYNKVSDKYDVAINSLNDYEIMMNKYKIENHENKNLLLTIRAMISNKEKDIPKYIDSIIKSKYKDNEEVLKKMNKIPSGGLRATIYSELLKIKEYEINYSLIIDKNISTIDFIEINTDTVIDVCKIIGVLIDNAIDESKLIENNLIGIELYIQEKFLNIKVSNVYKEHIEVDKIFNEGYTTKGKGHGYGLSLVKKIVDNNNLLTNHIEINNKIFSQIISLKIK